MIHINSTSPQSRLRRDHTPSSMDLEEAFFLAISIGELAERRIRLDQVCGDDVRKKSLLLSLLEIHESIEKTDLPAPTPATDEPLDEMAALDFLSASMYSQSLGRLERYEVVQVIAVGGMSVVVEAFDTYLKRIVALKILLPALARQPLSRERFQREAQSAAAIDHDHVTKIFAVDQQNGVHFLAMEFIQGSTLASRLEAGGIRSVDEIIRIGGEIAQGLAAIHEQGLVHRDLKPENVLLQAPDGSAKITDFGVVLSVEEGRLTRSGEVNGTPQFMSPEQAQGGDVDQRSDLFSFGTVLYTLATGRSPFEAASPLVSMKRVCDDVPPPLSELRGDLPEWLPEVVSQLLEKSPEDRLLSARKVAEIFETSIDRHRKTLPAKPEPRRRLFFNRWVAIAVTAVCLAAFVGLTTWLWRATDPDLPLYTRVTLLAGRFAHLIIETDDPDVVFAINARSGPFRQAGGLECYLPPGSYTLLASKGRRYFGSHSFSLTGWQELKMFFTTSTSEAGDTVLHQIKQE